ncbi:MAG: M15 family metallopeptidase [Bacteroidota bacterium]
MFFCFCFTVGFSQEFSLEQLLGKNNSHLEIFEDQQVEKQTLVAFKKMKAAAKKDGINIKIISGYRSFDRQKQIFENKYRKFSAQGNSALESVQKIITYSSIPGTSRHHWGTDIDIIDANQATPKGDILIAENYETGVYCDLYDWMLNNAADFGFELVYTKDENRGGFYYEPWHFSYRPVAEKMLASYLAFQPENAIYNSNILGINDLGINFLKDYLQEYALGINPKLKKTINKNTD